MATGRLGVGTMHSALPTPECLGLTLDQLGGDDERCGTDLLGIWQPVDLNSGPARLLTGRLYP